MPLGLGPKQADAVMIMDGLWVGDEFTAGHRRFFTANQVTRVINCCGADVVNHWQPYGVRYLTYTWVTDTQIIFDREDMVVDDVFCFVEKALDAAESVLIHSRRGETRSWGVLVAYMVAKYNWGVPKVMEFLHSRRPSLSLAPALLKQLSGFENRLMAQSTHTLSLDWNEPDVTRLGCEDLLLRNTYINSRKAPWAELPSNACAAPAKPRKFVRFDDHSDGKGHLEKPEAAGGDHTVTCKTEPNVEAALKGTPKDSAAVGNDSKATTHTDGHDGQHKSTAVITEDLDGDPQNDGRARLQAVFTKNPVASCAAVGACVYGAGGGVAGLTVGAVAGAVCGVPLAVFSFGLSVPIFACIAGGAGAVAGATTGGVAGAASCAAAAYGYQHRTEMMASVGNFTARVAAAGISGSQLDES